MISWSLNIVKYYNCTILLKICIRYKWIGVLSCIMVYCCVFSCILLKFFVYVFLCIKIHDTRNPRVSCLKINYLRALIQCRGYFAYQTNLKSIKCRLQSNNSNKRASTNIKNGCRTRQIINNMSIFLYSTSIVIGLNSN